MFSHALKHVNFGSFQIKQVIIIGYSLYGEVLEAKFKIL